MDLVYIFNLSLITFLPQEVQEQFNGSNDLAEIHTIHDIVMHSC